jgi:hypothetical protein
MALFGSHQKDLMPTQSAYNYAKGQWTRSHICAIPFPSLGYIYKAKNSCLSQQPEAIQNTRKFAFS